MSRKRALYDCTGCQRSFGTPSGLLEHEIAVHGRKHPFECSVCGKRCQDAVKLERHVTGTHGPAPAPNLDRRPNLAEIGPTCLECGGEGKLVGGQAIYPHRPDLFAKRFYLCECGAYCGCHPNSVVPLGKPCGFDTRRARQNAHEAFDPLWKLGEMTRHQAYAWLAEATGIAPANCHIGMMTAEQARLVIRVVLARRANKAA